MYPGLSDADCQVAELHFRQLVNEGQQQQVVAKLRPLSAGTRSRSTALRQQLGTLVVGVSRRLQGVQGITRQRIDPVPTGERGAVA